MDIPTNMEVLMAVMLTPPAALLVLWGFFTGIAEIIKDRRRDYYRNRHASWFYGDEPKWWC